VLVAIQAHDRAIRHRDGDPVAAVGRYVDELRAST
jgi:hypothetical protein